MHLILCSSYKGQSQRLVAVMGVKPKSNVYYAGATTVH